MHPRYPTPEISSKRVGRFYGAYFAVLGVVLPFLGPYLSHRALPAVWIGLATAAFSLAKLVYTPLVGRWVDGGRWFRGLLTAHLAAAAAMALLLPAVRGGPAIGAVLFVIGAGYGSVLPLVEAVVLERLPSVGYGPLRVWGSVGFVVVAVAAARLLGSGRIDVFPLAVACTLIILVATCWPFESIARARSCRQGGQLGAGVWLLLAVLTAHQITHGPYYAFFSIHLREHGMTTTTVGWMWSVGVIAELAAFLGGTRLEQWVGLRRILLFSLLLAPVRWLLLALPPSVPLLVMAQVGHAATFALVHLAGIQLVQRAVPVGSARRAQALYSGLIYGLGIVVGTTLAGPLYAAVGGRLSFAVVAAASVVVCVLALLLSSRALGSTAGRIFRAETS